MAKAVAARPGKTTRMSRSRGPSIAGKGSSKGKAPTKHKSPVKLELGVIGRTILEEESDPFLWRNGTSACWKVVLQYVDNPQEWLLVEPENIQSKYLAGNLSKFFLGVEGSGTCKYLTGKFV